MSDAINPLTGLQLSGRPAWRGPAQAEWDARNPNYAQQWSMGPTRTQQPQQPSQQPQTQPARPAAPAGGNFSAYSPGQAQSQQNPYATSTTYGQPASNTPPAPSQPSAGSPPYQAYSPANQQAPSQPAQYPVFQQQMPSFQFTGGTDWMGNQYTDPNAMMAQAGAMAQALNQQRQGMMDQGQFGSLNPQMAYNQGMGMLQQGWQNPFAQPPAFQQPQDPGNNIRDLIQGPPPPDSRYGLGLAEGARIPMDNRDDDGDGVVDYYQSGPGRRDERNGVQSGGPGRESPFGSRIDASGRPLPGGMTQDVIDSDRDGRDDRYQAGPGLDNYGRPARPMPGPNGEGLESGHWGPSAPNKRDWLWHPRTPDVRIVDDRGGFRPTNEDVRIVDDRFTYPGQAQPAQDPWADVPDARGGFTYPGQAQPAQDPYGSSTPYTPVSRPSNRPPPTADELRQQQTEIKQKEAVNDLYRRANLQPGASTDELMLGLINNSRGGTIVRPEALAGLPADIRGAVSQYQDLAGMAQGLDRSTAPGAQQRRQDIGAAMEQMKSRMTERAQASQALQRDYGMSPAEAAAWVNREMPMPDQAATMQGLQQKQNAYQEQARTASLDKRAKQDMEAARPKAPSATDQWNRIKATTNTQTKPLSPAHQRVYQAMVAESRKARGMGNTWEDSGSPIANWGRARNARAGTGFTGIR